MPKNTRDMSLIRVFQIALRGRGRKSTLVEGEEEILLGMDFLSGFGCI